MQQRSACDATRRWRAVHAVGRLAAACGHVSALRSSTARSVLPLLRSCASSRRTSTGVRRTSRFHTFIRARRPDVNVVRARRPERRVHLRVSRCFRQPACQGRRAAMSSKVSALLSCARLYAAAAHSSPRNARALAFRCGCCTRVRTLVRWPLRFAGFCALTLVLRSSTGEGHIVTVRDAGWRALVRTTEQFSDCPAGGAEDRRDVPRHAG